ncbi:TIGR00289 family protein [Candidatus Bathyarchaeota archaeon]|nr:TIGR00289 family protein [Candidatus Bathyarchaeota archaeon]
MKLGVLFSGGKDSSLALFKAQESHDVVCLISVFSKNKESYMFHVPNIELTKLQARAIGLPLIQKTTKGEKEKELNDLEKAILLAKERYYIEGIVTGAIESVYQSTRIQRICEDLDLSCLNPLWKKDQIGLLKELVQKGFKVIISGVFAYPLDESYLGKLIDSKMVERLKLVSEKYRLSPAGEGGEFETTVLDAPFFKRRIEIMDYEISYKDNCGVFDIRKARLTEK